MNESMTINDLWLGHLAPAVKWKFEAAKDLLGKDENMPVAKYRKKPVVIEAIKWDGVNRVPVAKFIKGNSLRDNDQLLLPGNAVFIETLEGTMRADKGDWIIKGVKGEFYPCKPDVFEDTYGPV